MIDLQEIRNHAAANYDSGGWYVLVECWDDKDILAFCDKFEIVDTQQAIIALGNGLAIYDDSVVHAI
jgi:hypothetical protein